MNLEIESVPPVDVRQRPDLGMHSLLNLLNVLMGQLYIIGILLEDREDLLEKSIVRAKGFIGELQKHEQAHYLIRELPGFRQDLLQDIATILDNMNPLEYDEELISCFYTLDHCFKDLSVRSCEVLHLVDLSGDPYGKAATPVLPSSGETDTFRGEFNYTHHFWAGKSRELMFAVDTDPAVGPHAPRCYWLLEQMLPLFIEHGLAGSRILAGYSAKADGCSLEICAEKCQFPVDFLQKWEADQPLPPVPFLAGFLWALMSALQSDRARLQLFSESEETQVRLQLPGGVLL